MLSERMFKLLISLTGIPPMTVYVDAFSFMYDGYLDFWLKTTVVCKPCLSVLYFPPPRSQTFMK